MVTVFEKVAALLDWIPFEVNIPFDDRHALGGSSYGVDHTKLSQMLSLPQDMVRNFRDDITITVVFFDTEYLRHCWGLRRTGVFANQARQNSKNTMLKTATDIWKCCIAYSRANTQMLQIAQLPKLSQQIWRILFRLEQPLAIRQSGFMYTLWHINFSSTILSLQTQTNCLQNRYSFKVNTIITFKMINKINLILLHTLYTINNKFYNVA